MSQNFEYKEVDHEGRITLESVAQAKKFNEWMYDTIQPFCNGKTLEIGSGIGNISEFFIRDKANLDLSDIRSNYCHYLKKRFPDQNVVRIDLVHPSFEKEYTSLLGTYDTVFALNVIEHIQDDQRAMANLFKLLKKGGVCIILVPAFQFLYNSFDKELQHYRRYSGGQLTHLMSSQFSIVKKFYFNPVGIIGWFLNGRILHKEIIPADQMKAFDKMVPLFRIINYLTRSFVGLSVIGVGEKL